MPRQPIPPPPALPASAIYTPEHSVGLQMKRVMALMGCAIDRLLEPLGLTDAQWKPLVFLLLGPPDTAAMLARSCHLDAGGLTRLIDRLQAKGLCQRQRSENDRRVVHVALTDAGRAVAEQIPPLLGALQEELLAGFSAAEQAQLRDFLTRMHANAQALGGPP
jgi:DNA-binding MarR family transcriptional regulator